MANKKEQSESKQEKVVVTQEEIDSFDTICRMAQQNAIDKGEDQNIIGVTNFKNNFKAKLEKLKNGESS